MYVYTISRDKDTLFQYLNERKTNIGGNLYEKNHKYSLRVVFFMYDFRGMHTNAE